LLALWPKPGTKMFVQSSSKIPRGILEKWEFGHSPSILRYSQSYARSRLCCSKRGRLSRNITSSSPNLLPLWAELPAIISRRATYSASPLRYRDRIMTVGIIWWIPKLLATIAADREFRCPAKVIQADPRCGAALLDGHEIRLAKANPKAEIVRDDGCGHRCHAQLAFYERFLMDLENFLEKVA
jgi:hypothetical protein